MEKSWLDALASDEEDDSSYVSSSDSDISVVSDRGAARQAFKSEAIKARVSRLFEEMNQSAETRPACSDDLYAVFNGRYVRPAKDTSADGVFRRIDLEHPIANDDSVNFQQFKRREVGEESASLKRRLPELLAAVEHEFIEIEEDGIFAGQVVKLKRKVSIHSEEAQRFLKRHKGKRGEQVSALDSYLESMKVKTVNTMGKTTADWSQFKETKGISRDLEQERKRGYLVDQAFLAKVSQYT